MLRVDARARPRLATIIANLRDRIAEARVNGWLGEIQGLQISLDAAAGKLAALDRAERAMWPSMVAIHSSRLTGNPGPGRCQQAAVDEPE